MSSSAPDNEKELVARALRRMRSKKRGRPIPAAKVKVFMAKVGEELASSGRLDETRVNKLLQQLKNGEL
jgi:hypothetical protein